jgi:hypothetical protein
MTQIPEGAERSPDGNYWWDGTNWQLVDQSQGGAAPAADTGQGGEQQETERRQVTVAADGVAGAEVPAPNVQTA